jgi:hypothetical protein
MKKKNAYILLPLMLLTACTTSKTISRADYAPAKDTSDIQGILYNLPATAIKVKITAQKTVEKRGPYYRYSQRYLNLSDIITEDRTYWEITNAHISIKGIPASDRLFKISTKGTPAGAAVSLTPDGILKGLNLAEKKKESEQITVSNKTIDINDISFGDIPFTEEQLIKTSSAATAEEVAAEIYRLRDSRRQLLESDMQKLPPDNGAYERILTEIDRMEKQYLSLFRGKKETQTIEKTFTFIPDIAAPDNRILFRFSEQKGFTDIVDMTGTPVYIEIEADSIRNNSVPEASTDPKERYGLIYCRPAKVNVKIIDRTVLLNEKKVLIGQYGTLHQLPLSILDDPSTTIKLDVNTGALLEIKTK